MDDTKVIDFFYQIGFTDEDIDEVYEEEADIVSASGIEYMGPDCLYAKVLKQEEFVHLDEDDEKIEHYWEKGWVSGFSQFRRYNFDIFEDRYRKVFPTRYRLSDLKFTRSLRRVLSRNRDLKFTIRPLRITPAKSDLHDTYHFLRYREMPDEPLRKAYQYIRHYPSELKELCIFKDKKLIGCSIFEVGEYAVYSNMSFWDLNEKSRGLGTLTILLEVQHARKLGMRHYYMGFFYPHNPNYLYKARFGGLELYDWDNDCWRDFNLPEGKALLKQQLPRRKEEEMIKD